VREHEDHVALYYALRRNADGMYNDQTGKYDGISAAYRLKLASAFVVDPDKPMDIPILVGDLKRKKIFEAIKANTIAGAATRIPQPVPAGTGEAAYPGMEHSIVELSSKDFFLKTLDRPHYPDGVGSDNRGDPIDDQGELIKEPQAKPQQQVNNDVTAALRAAKGPQ
jgi:hypothetical protein